MAAGSDQSQLAQRARNSSWRSVLVPLLTAIALIASVAILWLLYEKTASSNSQAQHLFESNLRLLRQTDAEWNLAVLRAKIGLNNNFDDLVELQQRFTKAQLDLTRTPVASDPDIQAALQQMATAFAEKSELVEQFKSRSAAVRNALRYIPTAAQEAIAAFSSDPEMALRISEAETQVLKFASMNDEGQRAVVVTAIDQMVAGAPRRPPSREAMDSRANFAHHASTFLAHRSREDRLVSDIVQTPILARIDHVSAAYEAVADQRLRTTERWRSALFAYSGAMLLCLGLIGSRLRKSYRIINRVNAELVSVNQDLEVRVAERTASLEASQEQLREALGQKDAMLTQERELGELKTRFVSMASHEFRTPLATIQTSTDLLLHYAERLTTQEKADSLNDIQRAVNRMKSVMENILMLGKLDAHTHKFQPVPTDLNCLFKQLVAETGSADAHAHAIELVSPEDSLGDLPLMDEALMRQIVGNLLTNACKYSPAGTKVRLVWRRVEGKVLLVEVIDEGIGIPGSDLPRLFETFHRASNTGTVQGTGLGLAIVKRAVDSLNGDIAVTSTVGAGTCFSVRLPWLV